MKFVNGLVYNEANVLHWLAHLWWHVISSIIFFKQSMFVVLWRGVWCDCVHVCKTGICVLRSYLCGRSFLKKIASVAKQAASKNFSDFSLLHDFMTEHRSNFQIQLLPHIEAHIKLLQENLRSILLLNRMPHLMLNFGYYLLCRFTYDNITTETEYLIDLQSDFGTILFKKNTIYRILLHVLNVPEHRGIAKKNFCSHSNAHKVWIRKLFFFYLWEIKSQIKIKPFIILAVLRPCPAPRGGGAFRGRAPQMTACAPPNENCAPPQARTVPWRN